MKSSVTICLVAEARQGPFVYHNGLEVACAKAAKLGFHAVEIFPASAHSVPAAELKKLLRKHKLNAAAFGTGAGWLRQQLSLSSTQLSTRRKAATFIRRMIDLAADFQAPAIVGSMQGRVEATVDREQALEWLAGNLRMLSDHAAERGQVLLFEPLNRYETNLLNRVEESVDWLQQNSLDNVRVLADLFHMNIEEADPVAAIRRCGKSIGHVHFADSNRQAIGFGHTRIGPIVTALRKIGYAGYLSAEIFPLPNSDQAAERTIQSFRQLIQST